LACSRALRLTLASCPPAPRAKESSRKGSRLHPALLEGPCPARRPQDCSMATGLPEGHRPATYRLLLRLATLARYPGIVLLLLRLATLARYPGIARLVSRTFRPGPLG